MKLTKRIDLEIGKTQVFAGLATVATIISVVGIIITRKLKKP